MVKIEDKTINDRNKRPKSSMMKIYSKFVTVRGSNNLYSINIKLVSCNKG